MIGGLLKLIGILALMGVSFFAGMKYQGSKSTQKLVAEKVQQKVDQFVEKVK